MSAFHRTINRAAIAPVRRTSTEALACDRHERAHASAVARFAAKWNVSLEDAAILLLDTRVRLPTHQGERR